MKKILIFVFLIVVFAACGGSDNPAPAEPEAAQAEISPVPDLVPADLLADPEKYVGQVVALTGTVQHVCEVSGKRMFLSGPEDPEKTFKVTAGRGIGEFSIDLNGSDVTARGEVVVQKVDQAYLDNWEAEMSAGVKPEAAHQGHGPEGDTHESEEEAARTQLENMRKALANSGKDQLLFYSLECTEFDVKS